MWNGRSRDLTFVQRARKTVEMSVHTLKQMARGGNHSIPDLSS